MTGWGTIVNTVAIFGGALIGLFFKRGLPEKYQQTIMQAIGLCIMVIGIQMALKTENIILTIGSLVLGALVGEILDLESKTEKLGLWVSKKFAKGKNSPVQQVAEGFVSSSILFCTGPMAIVGALQDALAQEYATLYAKAALDGIIALILSANIGVGVFLSGCSVALYQGSFTLIAGLVEPYMTETILRELTATGGVLIIAISLNLLQIIKIRIANLLPALLCIIIMGICLE